MKKNKRRHCQIHYFFSGINPKLYYLFVKIFLSFLFGRRGVNFNNPSFVLYGIK